MPGDDCVDTDPFAYPSAIDLPDDGSDQDCSGSDRTRSDESGVFVAMGAPDTNPGTMAAPVGTLASAISIASAAGKSVFVAEGTFAGATTDVSIFGGYEATGWTRDLATHASVIGGGGATAIATAGRVVLDGLEVSAGTGGAYPVAIDVGDGGAWISRCSIDGGESSSAGGASVGVAVHDTTSTTTISHSSIFGGMAHQPFGVIAYGETTLAYSHVDAGVSEYLTIGVQAYSVLNVVDSVVLGGRAANAVGIELRGDGARDTTLVSSFVDSGEGTSNASCFVSILAPVRVLAIDTVFVGRGGSAVLALGSGTGTLVHDLLWRSSSAGALVQTNGGSASTPAEVDACAWAGCTEASGTLSADPRVTTDHHLEADSPCLDAGADPQDYFPDGGYGVDRDGDPRPQGEGWDIGPDERP